MKNKLFIGVIFLCLPVTILTIAIIRRHSPSYNEPGISFLFQEIEAQHPSPALEAIKKAGAAAVPTLQVALREPQDYYKFKACWVMQQMGSTAAGAVPDVVQLLTHKEPVMQIYAMETLTAVGTTRSDLIPRMVEKLQDGRACGYAADLLEKIQQGRKASNLPSTFTDEYEYAMVFAKANWPAVRLRALPKLPLNDKRSMAAFDGLLHDTDNWVRQESAKFILRALPDFQVSDTGSLEIFKRLQMDMDGSVRELAARFLKNQKVAATNAVNEIPGSH